MKKQTFLIALMVLLSCVTFASAATTITDNGATFSGNVTANTGFFNINWSYVQAIPSYVKDWSSTIIAYLANTTTANANYSQYVNISNLQSLNFTVQINAVDSRATSINSTATGALSLATTANNTATSSLSLATTANNSANAGLSLASTANSTATSALSLATIANNTATTANTTANNALPKAGGTMTGTLTAQGNISIYGANPNDILIGANFANYPSGHYSAIYHAGGTFNGTANMYGALILQSRPDTARPIWFVQGTTPSPKLVIDADGQVGINTTSPANSLGINGDLSVSGPSYFSSNVAFDTNTLYVDSANNRVGIGTATPTYTFDVVGSANISSTLYMGTTNPGQYSGNQIIFFRSSGDSYIDQSGGNGIQFRTGPNSSAMTTRMTMNAGGEIDFSGNIDVEGVSYLGDWSTSAASSSTDSITSSGQGSISVGSNFLMDIDGTGAFLVRNSSDFTFFVANPYQQFIRVGGPYSNAYPDFQIMGDAGSNANTGMINFINYRSGSNYNLSRITASRNTNDNSGDLTFSIAYQGAMTDVMKITKDSRVGINTISPNSTLSINGVIQLYAVATPTCSVATAGGVYYNATTFKHYGCNSTAWNALY